jgi:hypothetical protein
MAQAAGVSRETLRVHIKDDPEFKEEIDNLVEQRNLSLEKAAHRRAVKGVIRNKYDKDGNLIEKERVYSDRLLEKLLEANNPEKFRPSRDQGGQAGIGGVLLIPMLTGPGTTDPAAIMDRLNQLSSDQHRLQTEGEGSFTKVEKDQEG